MVIIDYISCCFADRKRVRSLIFIVVIFGFFCFLDANAETVVSDDFYKNQKLCDFAKNYAKYAVAEKSSGESIDGALVSIKTLLESSKDFTKLPSRVQRSIKEMVSEIYNIVWHLEMTREDVILREINSWCIKASEVAFHMIGDSIPECQAIGDFMKDLYFQGYSLSVDEFEKILQQLSFDASFLLDIPRDLPPHQIGRAFYYECIKYKIK